MKKKILTLFLAFAIMMTFMPSMAFAVTVIGNVDINVTCTSPNEMSATWADTTAGHDSTPNPEGEVTYIFYSDPTTVAWVKENGKWSLSIGGPPTMPTFENFDNFDHVIVQGALNTLPIEICDSTRVSNATINGIKVAEDLPIGGTSTGYVDSNNKFAVGFSSLPIGDSTKINFYMYYKFPKAIDNVNVQYNAPKTVKDSIEVLSVDSTDYNMTWKVTDVNGNVIESETFKKGEYIIQFTFEALNGNYFPTKGNTVEYDGTINGNEPNESLKAWVADTEDGSLGTVAEKGQGQYLVVQDYFQVEDGNGIQWGNVLKIAVITAAVSAVVGVVVKNVQNAAMMQQAAFQAKMQQQMVQKQVASIKTVLKGAGVVFSLASFGSSLGKLFQLNQFGFR